MRTFPRALLVVAATLALSSCQDLAIQFYNQGIDAIESGDTAAAADFFRESLAIRDSDADAHFNLGVALLGLNQYDEALSELRIASVDYPDDPELHLNLAEVYVALGRYQSAKTEYQYALRRDHKLVEALTGYGQLLMEAGDYEEAEEHLTNSLTLRPAYAATHLALGWLYVRTQRYNEASHYFQRGLREDRNAIYGILGLAEADRQRERYADALAQYQKVLALDPNRVSALIGVGQCQLALNRHPQAIQALTAAIDREGDNALAHKTLADVHAARRSHIEAVSHYRMAIQLRSGFVDAYLGLGESLDKAGLVEEARAALEEGLTYDAQHARLLYRLGQVYIEMDDTGRALPYLRSALKSASDDVRLQQRIRATIKSLDEN